MAILHGLRSQYEEHHRVAIDDAAIEAAARLSDRYISEYRLPDKAIDLVDQAAARLRLRAPVTDTDTLRTELERLQAEKQAAVDAEDYEDAGRLKEMIDDVETRLSGLRQDSEEIARTTVGEQEIAAVVAARTGIPVGELVTARAGAPRHARG